MGKKERGLKCRINGNLLNNKNKIKCKINYPEGENMNQKQTNLAGLARHDWNRNTEGISTTN